jgi:hypothetical protein
MSEIIKFQYIEGKNKWVLKQDSYTRKWILYKNGTKIKTSQDWEVVAKEIPCYVEKTGRGNKSYE